MAGKTVAGMEAPATGLAPESGRCIDGVFGSSLGATVCSFASSVIILLKTLAGFS